MAGLPSGTVTFLFTDIEGSTSLLQQLGDRYADVLAAYRRLLRASVQERGGQEVDTQGDAFLFAFPRATDAVMTAVTAQRAIMAHSWPEGGTVRVRMGLHTGEPLSADTGYIGMDIHRAARICTAGHGGQILLSDTTCPLIEDGLPPDVRVRDLGQHRLKDLARPQHLFQVVVDGLPADFPSLKSLNVLPNNLPVQLTSFIGRKREIAEVKGLLSTTRLLTLTGAGGAGKTRLAVQVAAEVLEDFSDGVWLVELAALSDPALVPQAIASALGVPEQLGRLLDETVTDSLRLKSVLLVVDNCEHLLPVVAHRADVLLRGCPDLRVLATSREGLGIPGELTYRVPSLSLPDLQRLPSLENLTEYEAIRLFIERATFGQPGFAVTNRNALAVAQICHRLDGIPLAIEMAAARVKGLSVEQIASRLDDRFRLLTAGHRTALPRHQTLRATMDWSYDLLPEHERVMLRRLSVFAGGFTLEAAERVCAGEAIDTSAVLDLLLRLVDKSLVVAEERNGEVRYRLLEMIRQYGRDRLLESGEIDVVRRRHRDWYLELAEQADRLLHGPEQVVWLERVETDHDNLRAALEWSKTAKDGLEAGLRLAGALWWFWVVRVHWSEARGWLEGALSRCSDTAPPSMPKALQGAAYLAWRRGDYARATALCEKGLVLCRELGDRGNHALLLIWLANIASSQQQNDRARALGEESVALAQEISDKWIVTVALSSLGGVARGQRDYERAIALHMESLAVAREAGDLFEIAYQLRMLGTDALRGGHYGQATTYFTESLTLCQEAGNRWTIEECLEGLAGVAAGHGHHERAARLLGAAEVLRKALGRDRSTFEQAAHDQRMASSRAGLGDAAFAAAWAEGRAMTLEQAVEYALASGDSALRRGQETSTTERSGLK